MIHPKELDIDEVLDFLVSLNEQDQVNWRTSKMYPDDKCQDKFCRASMLLDASLDKLRTGMLDDGTDRFLGTRINVLNMTERFSINNRNKCPKYD